MRVRQGNLRDVHVEDGRAAVFVNDQVIVLSEVATAILQAVPANGSVGLEQITKAIVHTFGQPEPPLDAHELTRRHVLDLVAHHVLADEAPEAYQPFTPASVAALRDVLRHTVTADPSIWQLPDGVRGAQLMAAAERHRVVPTVAGGLDRLTLPPETAAALTAKAAQETATVGRLGAELAELVGALERAGVRVLAFKGLALALQAHGDIAARGTGDHDLLVPPEDLTRTHEVLTAIGWTPAMGFPTPGPSWAWRRLVRDYYELPLVRSGTSVDLHWHLGPVRNGFPTFDELWSRRISTRIGAECVATLSPYDALAHSAAHAARDHWRWLRGLLDVHLLAADPATWRTADRPLSHDQLLSVGLAARIFGTPPGSPAIVHEAVRLSPGAWSTAVVRQAGQSHVDVPTRIPGVGLYRALAALRRAGARPSDVWRQFSLSLVPPTYTTDLAARTAWDAVPHVLARRGTEVGRLWANAVIRGWTASRE